MFKAILSVIQCFLNILSAGALVYIYFFIYTAQAVDAFQDCRAWRILALLRTAVQWVEASVLPDGSWAQTSSKLGHEAQDTTRIAVLKCFDFESIFLKYFLPGGAFEQKDCAFQNDQLSPDLSSENFHLLSTDAWSDS